MTLLIERPEVVTRQVSAELINIGEPAPVEENLIDYTVAAEENLSDYGIGLVDLKESRSMRTDFIQRQRRRVTLPAWNPVTEEFTCGGRSTIEGKINRRPHRSSQARIGRAPYKGNYKRYDIAAALEVPDGLMDYSEYAEKDLGVESQLQFERFRTLFVEEANKKLSVGFERPTIGSITGFPFPKP